MNISVCGRMINGQRPTSPHEEIRIPASDILGINRSTRESPTSTSARKHTLLFLEGVALVKQNHTKKQ